MTIFIVLLFILCYQVKTSELSDTFWVGSSPEIRISSSSICSKSKGVEIIVSLQNQNQNTHIIYCRYCGLSTISIQKNKTVNIKNYGKSIKFQQIVLQPGTNNLWAADENYLYLFDVSQPEIKINQLEQIQKEKNAGVTIRIQFNDDKERLILVNKFITHLYNIKNIKNVNYVSAIQGEWEMYSVIISPQVNLVFAFEGYFRILRIINKDELLDSSKPILYDQVCRLDFFYSEFNQFVYDKYIIIKKNQYLISGINISKFITSNNCTDLVPVEIFTFRVGILKHILTADKKYIISIVSFQAIQILKLEYGDVITSSLFQEIDKKVQLIEFSISFDQQMIFISTQKYLDIYKRNEPNYKKINPSLLNLPQNIAYEEFSQLDQSGWQCYYAEFSKLIFYTKGNEGVYVFKENEESKFLEKQYQFTYIGFGYPEYVSTFNKDKNLIIGRDDHIYLYNIEDISKPKLLSKTNFNNENTSLDSGYITTDMAYLILSADTEGILVVDISDLSKPTYKTKIYHDYPESTPCGHISVSADENYVFASYRTQGLVIYDIKDKKNPKILSYLNTLGGESTTLMTNPNYILMSDRQNGLIIIDISDLLNPKQISGIIIDGYAKKSTLIHNEKFVLCVTRNGGQVALIDIRDLKNPKLLQKYQYKDTIGGFDMCTNKEQKVGYLSIKNAFIRINLYPYWQFNTDIYLLTEGKKIVNSLVDNNQSFQLGQTIKIKILQVYPNYNVTIIGAKFYYQYKIQVLPSWAFYSELDQSLTLKLDKNAIVNANDDEQTSDIQQFIFEIKQKLVKTDFISSEFEIDKKLSEIIFFDCLNQNIINNDYQVSQYSQDFIDALFQQKYSKSIIQFIIYTLKSKTLFYPIAIKVESSLKISFDSNSIPEIKSPSDYIQIEVYVDRNEAQFIETTYQGLLVYFNDKNDLLKLEGDKSQINLLIEKGIKLANFKDPSSIKITMTINDNINFPLIQNIYADHKHLIYLNKPIKINQENSLQSDFNQKFTDSVVYILESFTYTFSSDIFVDEDSVNITYEAKIYQDGEYKPIPESYWLSFQSKERQFVGTTTTGMYLDEIRIMVNATDGFTSVQDYFVVKITGVPIRIVLVTISQILGPIIGILGLWRYKSILYNNLYQKNFETTSIKINSGSEIQIQIPLLDNQLQIAQSIWFQYYNSLDKFNIQSEMNQIKQMSQQLQKPNVQKSNLPDTIQSQVLQFANSFDKSLNKETSPKFLLIQDEQTKQLDDLKVKNSFDYKPQQSFDQKRITTDIQKSNFFEDQKSNQETLNLKSSFESKKIQFDDQNLVNSENIKFKASEDQKGISFDDQKKVLVYDLQQQLEDKNIEIRKKSLSKIQKFQNKIVKNLTSKIIGYQLKQRKSFSRGKNISKVIQNSFDLKYFNSNGSLNSQFILNDILYFYDKNIKRKDDNQIKQSLMNIQSKLSRIILGLAAITFSKLEKSTFSAVQYLKKMALQNRYTNNDWYKYYINIESQFNQVFIDQFPLIIFNDYRLTQEISILYQSIQNKDKDMRIFLPFIKDVITAYAYGFTPEKGGYVPSIRGECLEIKAHQIQSIRGYCPIFKKKCCFLLMPGEVLVEKELSMNQILPSWIQSIDLSNDVILIKGKTENKDVGEHILKIFDKNNFIIKQIRIIIYPQKEKNRIINYDEEDQINSFIADERNSISMDETPCHESSFPNSFQHITNYSNHWKTIKHLENKQTQKQENQQNMYN